MPSQPKPLISVIIPSYNHEEYIAQSMKSALDSSVSNLELIVVDDGSTDDSLEIIRSVDDGRVRVLTQKNSGAHHAMNRGAALARGRWLAFLNSDDLYHREKLERHLAAHERSPELEGSASRMSMITASGAPLAPDHRVAQWYGYALGVHRDCRDLFKSLMVANHIATSSALFVQKQVFDDIGGFVPLRYSHDRELFLSLAARGGFLILEEPLFSYRVHDARTIDEDWVQAKVEAHLVMAWNLVLHGAADGMNEHGRKLEDYIAQYPSTIGPLLGYFVELLRNSRLTLREMVSIVNDLQDPIRQNARSLAFQGTIPHSQQSSRPAGGVRGG